jgi:outer membrane biogenesis lipoprotein LolB
VSFSAYVRGVVCVTMLALAGCASVPAPPKATEATVSRLAESFELTGRISVRVGDRLETAKIIWLRSPAMERLQLFTPFGSQVAEVVRNGSADVTLRRGTDVTTATSIAELTESLLGAPIDTEEIARWVQGGGLTEDEVVEVLLKDGTKWQVTAEKFQTRLLPDRVVTRLLAIKGDTVVRLFVDDWQRR